jgi:hypothetical protein
VNGSMETITSLMISKSYFNNLSQSVSQWGCFCQVSSFLGEMQSHHVYLKGLCTF